MGDLKAVWEQKQRREEMSQSRKEEIAKFRQMLCAVSVSILLLPFIAFSSSSSNFGAFLSKFARRSVVKRVPLDVKREIISLYSPFSKPKILFLISVPYSAKSLLMTVVFRLTKI